MIPQSRGGKHTYDNLVCCCRQCNEEKGNRTPQEWGRLPYREPYRPFSKLEIIVKKSKVEEWKQYIYS
jgi:5-methylcytosine-specific restriction endonuclease McrA